MKIKTIHIKEFKGIENIKIENCDSINAFVGKNNSGKSSLLHAIDIALLAHLAGSWDSFQPKLAIKDLINNVGNFEIGITYENDHETIVKTQDNINPIITNPLPNEQKLKSILILPDVGMGLVNRLQRTPLWIIQQIERRRFGNINSLEILYAIKYYASRNERELTQQHYDDIISEVSNYFPDIDSLDSDLTEEHIPTLMYEEYGKKLDILYSGTGLKHFLDVLVKTTLSGANIVLLDEPELGLHPDLQRDFFMYLNDLVNKKGVQIFMGTHSQVALNYSDFISFYRILNSKGTRKLIPVNKIAIETVLNDLGIRPSDVFNHDICLLVEGVTDVIFWEHIIRNIYHNEFKKIAIGIIQYGGSNVAGIIKGTIDVSNIVSSQKYTYWIHDRDSMPSTQPSLEARRFNRKFRSLGIKNKILRKREIEYYYPEIVHTKAQQGNRTKEADTIAILNGPQNDKYRNLATGLCVPSGKFLKSLLRDNVKFKNQLNSEIKTIVKNLIKWKKEIIGE
jgi:AAA15 family ATPase/GTPase